MAISECDVPFAEGTANLHWPNLMKQINEDPAGFYREGGWEYLKAESDVRDWVKWKWKEMEGNGRKWKEMEGNRVRVRESIIVSVMVRV